MSFSLVPLSARDIREGRQKILHPKNREEEIKTFDIHSGTIIGEGVPDDGEW